MAATGERTVRRATGGEASGGAFAVRDAVPGDLEAVVAIEAASFSNPWSVRSFRALLGRSNTFIPVAESEEEGILGYAVFWWAAVQGELANLAVREEHRGRGIGSALLTRVQDHARSVGVESLFLEVRISNQAARHLYSNRGFREVAVRRDYYRKPREDALILVKALGEES